MRPLVTTFLIATIFVGGYNVAFADYGDDPFECDSWVSNCPGVIGGHVLQYNNGSWDNLGTVDEYQRKQSKQTFTPTPTPTKKKETSSNENNGQFKTITIAPGCPFSASGDDIVVEFRTQSIRSDMGVSRAREIANVSIPSGNYKVSLASFDGDPNTRRNQSQPYEQYYVSFLNGSNSVAETNDTPDLADYVDLVTWKGVVNNNLYIPSGVNKVNAWHSAYPSSARSNSLVALCMLMEPLSEGPYCGDGNLDPGEMCDDGNNIDGDGCSAVCTYESGPYCGDGNLDPGEMCDDGNNIDGDGCSAVCTMGDPEPLCTMSLNPTNLPAGGGNITLSWDSLYMTDVNIDHGIGAVAPNGSMVIFRSSNATYTGYFSGPYGDRTCTASVKLGGGGDDPPRVSLSQNTLETEPSFIYLSQIPYTATPVLPANTLAFLFRFMMFGGLLFGYYKIK